MGYLGIIYTPILDVFYTPILDVFYTTFKTLLGPFSITFRTLFHHF